MTTPLCQQPVGKIWDGIKSRCYNPTSKVYKNYGGRGIKMCILWKNSREAFVEWALSTGYEKGMTIERKDNNKGYSPDNCCWIPLEDQAYNRRNTTWIIWEGQKVSLAKLAKQYGMDYIRMWQRINTWGWSISDALRIPVKTYRKKNNLS